MVHYVDLSRIKTIRERSLTPRTTSLAIILLRFGSDCPEDLTKVWVSLEDIHKLLGVSVNKIKFVIKCYAEGEALPDDI